MNGHYLFLRDGCFPGVDTVAAVAQQMQLLFHLSVTNIRVRYRSVILGFVWAFITPAVLAGIFYVVFSLLLRVDTKPYPFYLYVLSALFPWIFFQSTVMQATTAVIDNKHLIKEAAFSRELLPLSICFANVLQVLPGFLVVMVLLIGSGLLPLGAFFLPFVIIVHALFAFSCALIVSSWYVYVRDVRYVVDIVLMAVFYMTPVFYPLDFALTYLSGWMKVVYMVNPMVWFILLYRICLLKDFMQTLSADISIGMVIGAVAVWCCLITVIGVKQFSYLKKRFTDYIST